MGDRPKAQSHRERDGRFSIFDLANVVPASISRVADGVFTDVNDAFLTLFGYTRDEILGHRAVDLGLWVLPEERELLMQQLHAGGSVQQWPTKFRRKSGAIGDVLMSAELIDLNGERTMFATLLDITERKRAEEKLRTSQVFLDRIIECSPNALWISDEFGTLLRMNQACRDTLHLRDEEVVGKYNIRRDNRLEEQGFMPMVHDVFERGIAARFVTEYDTAAVKGLELEHTTKLVLDVGRARVSGRSRSTLPRSIRSWPTYVSMPGMPSPMSARLPSRLATWLSLPMSLPPFRGRCLATTSG